MTVFLECALHPLVLQLSFFAEEFASDSSTSSEPQVTIVATTSSQRPPSVMKSFGVRSRRCRDDQRASLKQRLFGYFSVCFLSSPPSADEVKGLQKIACTALQSAQEPGLGNLCSIHPCIFQDKSSSNGSSPKVHCTQRTERQARKKLSSSCSTSHSMKVWTLCKTTRFCSNSSVYKQRLYAFSLAIF